VAEKIMWSREEAVILLDALIQVVEGNIDRKSAIAAVSLELRTRAQKNGWIIDEVFRNVNGITLQMSSMEYVLTDGASGIKHPTKLFREVVDLYKHDKAEYLKILKGAKGVAEESSIEERFSTWLSEKVSPRKRAEFLASFQDIESFCLERKILKKKIFETTDVQTVKAVLNTVNSNKVFRFFYKKNVGKASSAIRYYYEFVKELATSGRTIPRALPQAIVPDLQNNPAEGKHDDDIKEISEVSAECAVDFSSNESLAFTKPNAVSYFEESVAVNSWTQAYIQSVAFLLDDYPDTFARLLNKSVSGRGRMDFTDKYGMTEMTAPKKVAENFYIETNFGATDIVAKIRCILDLCNVDYENLGIRYVEKHTVSEIENEPEEEHHASTSCRDSEISDERDKFAAWMKSSGIASSTISSYLSAIVQVEKALKSYEIAEADIFSVTDADTLVRYRDALFINTEFKKINEQQHNRFRAALNKLIDYRSIGNPIELPQKAPAQEIGLGGIQQIQMPDFAVMPSSNTDQEYERLDEILRNNFLDGLLPNALRLDKFRMLYQDEFGCELTQNDDLLLLQLKRAGSFIDGRIYPKQDTAQNNLVKEILIEVINELNNGARCVYISCVMERWRQQLANQLNVYNEDTLRALLRTQQVPGLFLTENVFKATLQKVYPEENVLELMRESHVSMTYQQIQDKLWYIPLDVIKRALVSYSQIVNVDSETYFYAPNFPASASELQHLKNCMASGIAEKGYLVAPDIAEIIHRNCSAIAINTPDYKDWAYRNVLKYIFRDDFQFSGSVVCEKGKPLEMWQVYRDYCRNHEHITLRDLKFLKDELGVTIYWDTVIEEMVRINANELVRRDLIHFDIEATDKILDEMCQGDYIPLKNISLYLHFPPVEYQWNEFVLESYLNVSKAFKLYHASYANHGVFGVIVRANSKFEDYRSVVVDMLAHSDEWKTSTQALDLIVDKGYQARKRWTNFELVTQEAGLIREKLEAERK
jgi:hypothetical protein